jgi:hypothetical protein
VAAAARGSVEAAMAERETGISDADWWAANAPLLEQVLEPSRFPIASRVGSATGEEYAAPSSPDTYFAFGLERILDGIEVLVDRRRL